MSESSKVWCPICGNLLTNFTDYSVYRCGACDAVLRGTTLELEVLSERSNAREMFGIGGVVSDRSSGKSEETNTEVMMMAKRITKFGNNANSSYPIASRYENHTQDFVGNGNGNSVVGLQRAHDWNRRALPSTSYYLEEERYQYHHHQNDQFDGIGYIVDDDHRAEVLRKLNELTDQVNRTYGINADKSNDKFLVDNRMVLARTPYIIDHYGMDVNSQQLRRGYAPFEHKPFCTGLYMDRNRVHGDSFESYHRHHDLSSSSSRNSKNKLPISAYDERWYETSYDESYRSKSPRVLRTAKSGYICQPIAGGAPFLTCRNCFKLLLLPKKVVIEKKVKCGGCSITIEIIVGTNDHAQGNQTYQNDDEGTSKQFHSKMSFSYEDDFDNSGSDFQQRGRELGFPRSTSQASSRKSSPKKTQNVHTSPPRVKESIATEMDVKSKEATPPPPAGSSLQQYFDYSDKFRVMKHMENDTQGSRQRGLSMAATEIDISSNEFSIAGTSLNSGEASKEGSNKVAEHMKNSFMDLNISKNELIISEEKIDITINGKVIPDFLIKKAEKIAGSIYPGHYWYDFRAGFWGVMEGPCLGIIPPFIEEFNYPMPESCTGGKTGVFVNGRELHEKDLKLLSRRGLPIERDRSYILEISGRVLDQNTSEELERLGKLAPTVERSNHGFGMRVPKPPAAGFQ